MSWRRFVALVAGLGPHSLWVVTAEHRDRFIDDARAAERAVFGAMGV